MKVSLQTYLLRISGILLIIAYVYLRFIRERALSNLYFIEKINEFEYEIFIPLILLCMLFLVSSFTGIYITIKQLYKQPLNIPKNKLTYLLMRVVLFIQNALKAIEEYLGNNIEDSYEKIRNLVLKFYHKYNKKINSIIIIFYCMPYGIVSIIFIWEIFYSFKLNLFYKILPLMLIPLLFLIWFYLIQNLTNNLNMIRDLFNITHERLSNGKDQIILSYKPESNITYADFIQYNREYLCLLPLEGFLHEYKSLADYYKPRILLFMNICFFSGWFFVLVKNLMFILMAL